MKPMVVAILAISLLAAIRRRIRAGIVLLVGFALALLVAGAVRETMFDPYLYPSGHALRATYVAVAFAFVVATRGASLLAGAFAALIAVYAVRTGSHYSEEVVGGVLLGWAFATGMKGLAGGATPKPVEPVIDLRERPPDASAPGSDTSSGQEGPSRPTAIPTGAD